MKPLAPRAPKHPHADEGGSPAPPTASFRSVVGVPVCGLVPEAFVVLVPFIVIEGFPHEVVLVAVVPLLLAVAGLPFQRVLQATGQDRRLVR